jgi:hypothetical protein
MIREQAAFAGMVQFPWHKARDHHLTTRGANICESWRTLAETAIAGNPYDTAFSPDFCYGRSRHESALQAGDQGFEPPHLHQKTNRFRCGKMASRHPTVQPVAERRSNAFLGSRTFEVEPLG